MHKKMENIKKLQDEVRAVAKEKNAIILAHNYQLPEIQDVAHLTGDSLELSIKASKTDADMIVFCGVRFMAETASVICPDKKVILPVPDAGCEMADMINPEKLQDFKDKHPGVPVVTYINSTADVKALSDICCTSANAVSVVKHIRTPEIIMTPDKNLALWTQRHTAQKIYIYSGFCPIHDNVRTESIITAKKRYPQAVILAHPECPPYILDIAHAVKSTSGMLEFAKNSKEKEFIIVTESGLIHTLKKQNPEKIFHGIEPEMLCENMKKTTLGNLLIALKKEENIIKVAEDIRKKAYIAVKRMIDVPRD